MGWRKAAAYCVGLACLLSFQFVQAAEIKRSVGKPGEEEFIRITGEFVKGDDEKFKKIVFNTEKAIVVFDSPGGLIFPALEIGRAIRFKGFGTMVGGDCYSACAVAWLAGEPRMMSKTASIGFHAAYTEDEAGKKTPAAVGNALIGAYLNKLGLSDRVVAYVTTAGPEQIKWLKKTNADVLGLSVVIAELDEEELKAPPKKIAQPAPAVPNQLVQSPPGSVFKDCAECPEMAVIPAGSFLMGSDLDPFNERMEAFPDEFPEHRVDIRSFAIGKYEVTQEQYYALMGLNPSRFKGRTLPVENVSWDDAQEFVQKLNSKSGKTYRLPSEAEWEYAARAGSKTDFSFGNDLKLLAEYAWFGKNSDQKTQPVGLKRPNAFGLFDMHGNVWEWTQDFWHENYNGAPTDGRSWTGEGDRRVLRGGSWISSPFSLRLASRGVDPPESRNDYGGFRVARTMSEGEQPDTNSSYKINNAKPVYPAKSKRDNEQGTVILRVLVQSDGTAGSVEVKSSSGYPALDQAALDAVKTWRFNPATSGGKAVDEWFQVPIPFTLRN